MTLYKMVNGETVEMTPDEEAAWLAGLEPVDLPSPFKPIEPVPFWTAAWDLLTLRKSEVLGAIVDDGERYLAELAIEGRKTYLRDDPFVVSLATLKGYPPEQMDSLWLYVQENYK